MLINLSQHLITQPIYCNSRTGKFIVPKVPETIVCCTVSCAALNSFQDLWSYSFSSSFSKGFISEDRLQLWSSPCACCNECWQKFAHFGLWSKSFIQRQRDFLLQSVVARHLNVKRVGRFWLHKRRIFFTMRVVRYWSNREVVDAPSMEVLMARLDGDFVW